MAEYGRLPPREHVTPDRFASCDKAVALLRRTQPAILDNYVRVYELLVVTVCFVLCRWIVMAQTLLIAL